mgnify:CR=1 FL=1
MCELFNRQLGDDAVAFWIAELSPFYGDHLFEALRQACLEKWMPGVGWVIDKAKWLKEAEENQKRHEENERRKKNHEAEIKKREEDWEQLSQEQRNSFNAIFDEAQAELRRMYPNATAWMASDGSRGIARFRAVQPLVSVEKEEQDKYWAQLDAAVVR